MCWRIVTSLFFLHPRRSLSLYNRIYAATKRRIQSGWQAMHHRHGAAQRWWTSFVLTSSKITPGVARIYSASSGAARSSEIVVVTSALSARGSRAYSAEPRVIYNQLRKYLPAARSILSFSLSTHRLVCISHYIVQQRRGECMQLERDKGKNFVSARDWANIITRNWLTQSKSKPIN
jgi:hypothetical protein